MSHDLLFSMANTTVLAGWIMLIFFPGIKLTKLLIRSGVLSLAMSFAYLCSSMVAILSDSPGEFGSLIGVMQLFESKDWVLAGWIHYLAFDLLVGSWICKDAISHKIKHIYIVPALILTFILGPVGFLTYYFTRAIKTRQLWVLPT